MKFFGSRCWMATFALCCGTAASSGVALAQPSPASDAAPSRSFSYTRTASPLGSSRTVSMDLPLSNRQAVRLHGGYEDLSSFPKDDNFNRFGTATMKLRTVPIGADYVVHLADPDRRVVPVASVGVSVNLSRVSVAENVAPVAVAPAAGAAAVPFTALVTGVPEKETHMGVGYDVHAALGLRANVGRNVFVLGQARVRHVDALAFSQDDLVSINKLDFVVGVGFKF